MPWSYSYFDSLTQQIVGESMERHCSIQDVGPGAGKYSNLLRDRCLKIDCVEIFEPYIGKYNLHDLYDNVFNMDILEWEYTPLQYDLVILGDILEHLTYIDAKKLLERLKINGIQHFVAVPFESPQGVVAGNSNEAHLQEDLTAERMSVRYPELKEIITNPFYGLYRNE